MADGQSLSFSLSAKALASWINQQLFSLALFDYEDSISSDFHFDFNDLAGVKSRRAGAPS